MRHDPRTQAAIDAGYPEWAELPASAKGAKAAGARHYFTGRPCKHGHVSNRYTSTGVCKACEVRLSQTPEQREKARAYWQRPDVRERERAWMREYWQRPEVKARSREYHREYNKLPHVKEKANAWARRNYRENPPSEEQKSQGREYMRAYWQRPDIKEANRRRMRSIAAERNARKLNATPPWLTDEQRAQIHAVYEEARRLTEETGIEHHVDHIVPLKAVDPLTRKRNACGLHVPWNLQVLTACENIAKLNRFDGGWGT